MDDVSPEELTEAWASVWMGPPEQIERIGAAHIAADHVGLDLRTHSLLWQTACTVPDPRGREGRRPAAERGGARLHPGQWSADAAVAGARGRRAGDPGELLGEAAIALSTVQYLVVPGWAGDLRRYQVLMGTLLATSAASALPPEQAAASWDGPPDDGGKEG
jgi:hypothetical protein